MSEAREDAEVALYLVGLRLREPLFAEDYLATDAELHVGDLAVVEASGGTAVAEVRRPKRPLPEFKRGRLYRRVIRRATPPLPRAWRRKRA